MASETREALEKQVQRAIFQESIFRTESALAIAFFVIMTVLSALGFLPSFLDSQLAMADFKSFSILMEASFGEC